MMKKKTSKTATNDILALMVGKNDLFIPHVLFLFLNFRNFIAHKNEIFL